METARRLVVAGVRERGSEGAAVSTGFWGRRQLEEVLDCLGQGSSLAVASGGTRLPSTRSF